MKAVPKGPMLYRMEWLIDRDVLSQEQAETWEDRLLSDDCDKKEQDEITQKIKALWVELRQKEKNEEFKGEKGLSEKDAQVS
jgi:hypothetical protein